MIRAVHARYMELLCQYWVVGGLPEAVASFAADRDFTTVGRKFKYSHVSHEHRAAELAAAWQQLCMARSTQMGDQTRLEFELLSLPLYRVGQARRLLAAHFV